MVVYVIEARLKMKPGSNRSLARIEAGSKIPEKKWTPVHVPIKAFIGTCTVTSCIMIEHTLKLPLVVVRRELAFPTGN